MGVAEVMKECGCWEERWGREGIADNAGRVEEKAVEGTELLLNDQNRQGSDGTFGK